MISERISIHVSQELGFLGGASGKEPSCQCRRLKRHGFDPWVRKIPWRREWLPIRVFLQGESHGQRNLAGYSREGHKESDMTEQTCHARIIAVWYYISSRCIRSSLVVQWLGLSSLIAMAEVQSIPGWGAKIPQATQCTASHTKKLQVYNVVIHNFKGLYSTYNYYKILAIFPILYNIFL